MDDGEIVVEVDGRGRYLSQGVGQGLLFFFLRVGGKQNHTDLSGMERAETELAEGGACLI